VCIRVFLLLACGAGVAPWRLFEEVVLDFIHLRDGPGKKQRRKIEEALECHGIAWIWENFPLTERLPLERHVSMDQVKCVDRQYIEKLKYNNCQL
jgi:hypothetical protein